MFIIENELYCIFPVYYNLIERYREKSFSLQAVDAQYSKAIETAIRERDNNKIFAIDMQFVTAFPDSNDKTFEVFTEMSGYKLIFYNIQENTHIKNLILQELGSNDSNLDIFCYSISPIVQESISGVGKCTAIFLNHTERTVKDRMHIIFELNAVYSEIVAKAIKANCIDNRIQYLPSSDVYSNMYIKIKTLFSQQIFSFCIYLLCKLIKDNFAHEQIDFIVSTSNTGTILANLIGKMLNKDVLFCSNVGPRFALDIQNIRDKVSKGCNCLCVFDFVCLGTEIKNLKTLLLCFNANLIGGVGIASYPSFNYLRGCKDSSEEKQSVLTRLFSLVNINEHGFHYKISLEPFPERGI